ISISLMLLQTVYIYTWIFDPSLPLSCLRLLVPPFQLVSAAVWQTIQQKVVSDYGMLEEFVSMVTDVVPELLTSRQRAQLILGLRARVSINRIVHYQKLSVAVNYAGATNTEPPLSDFADQVHNLLKKPQEREHFFLNVFPKEFGPKYDEALHNLMWLFLSRLEKFLSHQTFQQIASMFADVSSALEECMESVSNCEEVKTLLQNKNTRTLPTQDSITTYKDLTNLAPVSNSSEDDSLSNCSDEDPSNMASVHDEDFTVLDKAQGTSDIKPAAARKTHSATRRGRCCICKEQVQANMNAHMKTHFPNGDYACPRCDTKFTILSSLRLHLRRTCYDQQQCNECEKAFRYKLSLDEHKRTHNQLYCEVCRKVLRDPETLARHKASHTPFQCTLCEENFRLYKPLARHYENVHKLSRPFKCNHCPKSFSKLRYFIGHEWKHTGRLPFQCAQCHMRFKHDADLVSHLRVHTREKPFLCADCGKAFSCRSNLRRHLNFLHSQSRDERRYSCSLCEKSFKEKGALKKHEKSKHLQELFRYPCLYCGKLFSSSAMGRHKLIHTGEKPYKCQMPECDKHFRSTAEMKRHVMQYHTEERPFKCNVCGRGFIMSCLLKTHARTHSGEKPYICSLCGKAFPTLYSMKRHKKLMHTFDIDLNLKMLCVDSMFCNAVFGTVRDCFLLLISHLMWMLMVDCTPH
uniref:C2H2-type domain-containing protein n=1 Tax=Myripristis murdjan TaxID=586833 RepID=A0A668AX78_9TELE